MNYFARIGQKLVFKIISYGILMHASLCIAAVIMPIAAPFVVLSLWNDIKLTNEIIKEAQVISVPLVNRSEERGDARTGKFLCYVELPDSGLKNDGSPLRVATPYLRTSPPNGLDSLRIYSHPSLVDPSVLSPRIIEVSTDRSWKSVFQALRGRSIVSAVLLLCSQFLLGFVVIYLAIKGYFFIKYGPRRNTRR